METTIFDFRTSFYIPSIKKLAFHLPPVHIIGTNHCGELRHTVFKQRESFQDLLFRRDYAEREVESFAHQIRSEYYGGNISASIEVIALGYYSALPKTYINSTTPSHQNHAVFHSFYLMIAKKILPLLLHTANV